MKNETDKNMPNTEEIKNGISTGDVKDRKSTGNVKDIKNTGDAKDMKNTGEIKDITNAGETINETAAGASESSSELNRTDGDQMMNSQRCRTKYPIVLIHGIGYSDSSSYAYWGDIPEALEACGARVMFGGQAGFGEIKDNARQLRANLRPAAEKYGKLNLIAHSKGGLEARYLVSRLDMADRVASVTTMGTPHRGNKTMDIMNEQGKLSMFLNMFRAMLKLGKGELSSGNGDFMQMTADYMSVFNELVPNAEGVYYQSYAFDMKKKETEPGMNYFYSIIKKYEGANDGIVSVESAKWGDFRGVWAGEDGEGISHSMAAGGRGKKKDQVRRFYIRVVERLKYLGY